MKRLALVLLGLAGACGGQATETTGAVHQSFASAEAALVDLELDGRLHAASNDPAAVRSLIEAQLLYTVGPLNADRSVGVYGEVVVSNVVVTPAADGGFEVAYEAKLPVAWGGGDIPGTYDFRLPRAVAHDDQIAFSRRYAERCADPEGGIVGDGDAGRLFLFYRPRRPGCVLDAADVVNVTARVTRSSANTTAKSPEYHRIWSDRALRLVYVFGVEHDDVAGDAGRDAYARFVTRVEALLGVSATRTDRETHAETTLHDGRLVSVDVRLVGEVVDDEGPSFDAWFDALTPRADLVMYSGHAGLGANVRALSTKGRFDPGQYVIWATNGCDTLAYVDRTLAERRAALNPDDPAGTKYMDVVSNALGSWFHAGDDTAFAFFRDLLIAGGDPPIRKTYRQIFEGIDPSQVIVVTGEEDNEEAPTSLAPAAESPSTLSIPIAAAPVSAAGTSSSGGCASTHGPARGSWPILLLVGLCLVAVRRRD